MLNDKAIESIASNALLVSANALNDAWPVPSPCVSVCQMSETSHLCQGCLRTIDEIRLWGNASADFKREVWAKIEVRLTHGLP